MTGDLDNKTVAIGVGSAGARIVSMLSKESLLLDEFVYISCDQDDFSLTSKGKRIMIKCPFDQKLTPSLVRGLALAHYKSIKEALNGAKIVFVIAGLGRATGSGLAPLVAQIAQECGAITISVAVMPFEFEKKLRFYAGVSLRRLRTKSRGVIVIDNDTLLKSSPDSSTLADIYELANREAVKALASLLSKQTESTICVGLNKILGSIQNGYSLLGISSSGSIEKAEEALAGAVISISKIAEAQEADHAIVILTGDSTLSANDVGLAVKRLPSMMNNECIDVEYGVNYNGSEQLQVSLLASGFKSTKYDNFDPLHRIFKNNVIDDDMDYSLCEGLERLQQCE